MNISKNKFIVAMLVLVSVLGVQMVHSLPTVLKPESYSLGLVLGKVSPKLEESYNNSKHKWAWYVGAGTLGLAAYCVLRKIVTAYRMGAFKGECNAVAWEQSQYAKQYAIVQKIVIKLAEKMRIAEPALYMTSNKTLTGGFAGAKRLGHDSAIFVNPMLVKDFFPNLESVLAHEMSHIKNNDRENNGALTILRYLSFLAPIAKVAGDVHSKSESATKIEKPKSVIDTYTFAVALPLMMYLMEQAYGRSCEAIADLAAMKYASDSSQLIELFKKADPRKLDRSMYNFLKELALDHPFTDKRIEYLEYVAKFPLYGKICHPIQTLFESTTAALNVISPSVGAAYESSDHKLLWTLGGACGIAAAGYGTYLLAKKGWKKLSGTNDEMMEVVQ